MKKRSLLFALLLFACNLHGQSVGLDKFIDSYVKENNFNGTILIQQRSKVLYHRSFGLANFELKIPGKNETKYKVASITKLFTSVLIMQAYEKGTVDLNSATR